MSLTAPQPTIVTHRIVVIRAMLASGAITQNEDKLYAQKGGA